MVDARCANVFKNDAVETKTITLDYMYNFGIWPAWYISGLVLSTVVRKNIENQLKIGPVCYSDMSCFFSLVNRIRIWSKYPFLALRLKFRFDQMSSAMLVQT